MLAGNSLPTAVLSHLLLVSPHLFFPLLVSSHILPSVSVTKTLLVVGLLSPSLCLILFPFLSVIHIAC